ALATYDYFPDVLSRFDISVRFGDLRERKGPVNVGSDPSLVDAAHDLAGPARDFLALAPHVAQVQPEHAFVAVHQGERIESGRLQQGLQGAQFSLDAGG